MMSDSSMLMFPGLLGKVMRENNLSLIIPVIDLLFSSF